MKNNKEKIINSARELFATQGFEVTTIDQIVQYAGVSKGLVYHFYKSKVELLRDIIRIATSEMISILDITLSKPDNNSLQAILNMVFDTIRQQKLYYQFNLSLLFQPATSSLVKDLIMERSTLLFERTYALFMEKSVEDAKLSTYMFLAEIDGICVDYLSVFDHYPLTKMKNLLLEKYKQ